MAENSRERPLLTGMRRPVLPSHGGLLDRSFVYRSASKTDVRLTWAQAKNASRSVIGKRHADILPESRTEDAQDT